MNRWIEMMMGCIEDEKNLDNEQSVFAFLHQLKGCRNFHRFCALICNLI